MWTAAGDSGELATALIPAVWTFLGIVVVTLGTIYVQARKERADRRSGPVTTSEPVAPSNGNGTTHLLTLAREVGQLDQRANDTDEAIDLQDRRLNRIERYLDTDDPEWRSPR